jgi:hypothetical protein
MSLACLLPTRLLAKGGQNVDTIGISLFNFVPSNVAQ